MNALITIDTNTIALFAAANAAADKAAGDSVWGKAKSKMAPNSQRKAINNLKLFEMYLKQAGVIPYFPTDATPTFADLLWDTPQTWSLIQAGLVDMFMEWLRLRGYSISTMNGALSTIKVLTKAAVRCNALDLEQQRRIAMIEGYSRGEGVNADLSRKADGIPTRIEGSKKAEFTVIDPNTCKALKRNQPNTPQGRQAALIFCLLIDHGLRVGELALVTIGGFNFPAGELTFYRPKVRKNPKLYVSTIRLSRDTRAALKACADAGELPVMADDKLLRATLKNGKLDMKKKPGMSERAITERVNQVLKGMELSHVNEDGSFQRISAHDLRHTWATNEARAGASLKDLMQMGGWSSPAMPMRYIEWATIANNGARSIDF